MKKATTILMAVLLMLMVSCNKDNAYPQVEQVPYVETKTEADKMLETETLEINFDVDKTNWEKHYYKDKFGDFTGKCFYTNPEVTIGKFSNTATSNSRLAVVIYVEKDYIGFRLFEYGTAPAVTPYSLTNYTLIMKTEDGDKLTSTVHQWGNSDVVTLFTDYDKQDIEILNYLIKNERKVIRFFLQDRRNEYLFNIDFTGFSNVWKDINE